MSDSMLTMMVGCEHAHEIWSKLDAFFASQTRAKVKQFKSQLRLLKKNSLRMSEYILKVKHLVNSLASLGSPISAADHIDALLDGLSEDYNGFIVSVTSRADPYSVLEIESLLVAQEERIEHYKKDSEASVTLFANFAQTSIKDSSKSPSPNPSPSPPHPPT